MKKILSFAVILLLTLAFTIPTGIQVAAAEAVNATCRTQGHLWCGVTGHFEQRPGPGTWTDHEWWYEVCSRPGCNHALPIADIYLQFLEPGQVGHATGKKWDGAGAVSWSRAPEEVIDRLTHTFNVRWKDIADWMNFGIVTRVEYVLDSQGIAWASGRRSGLCYTWVTGNPWDIDCMTHELIHNTQLYANVPVWVLEGMADYARAQFGLFNEQAGRMLAPSGREAGNPSTDPNSPFISGYVAGYNRAATFFIWIEENYNPNFVQELNYSMKAELVTTFQEDVLDALQASTGVRGVRNPGGQGKFHLDGRQFAWLTGNRTTPRALEGERSTVVNALWAEYLAAHMDKGEVKLDAKAEALAAA
jgi:hypothetical protein